ncbi:MAG: teicoplanin resistance protein VanZ [Lachnospiraceae bacterium]|nr:teicoplanin resistance protein VanZ [Lachnospiraceae bacterium]
MSNGFIEWRQKKNIRPVILPNKEKFYMDLINIENSWSGRMDVWSLSNTFIMEAEQQLINAMELFEKGYFDCAYYSLRSAVDISTTIVFLSDMPEEERVKFTEAWKETEGFPMQGQMLSLLSKRGNVFADMKEKMDDFFIDAKELSAELNKYVHKQGLRHFYISRNHPFNNRPQETFIKNFEYYLKRCIGVLAVMRLAIDPFPVLLMDEEILYRCFDSMTDPYSEDFVDEYIGQDTINAYKSTEIYQGTYESFITEERKTEAAFNVVKHQYIDTRKMDMLLQQLSLMSKDDVISVLMVHACNKVVKTYCAGVLQMYFTEKKTNRIAMSWSGLDFKNFEEAEDKLNQPYDEAYISAFTFGNESYFAEHNEKLNSDDAAQIFGLVFGALFKMNALQDENVTSE